MWFLAVNFHYIQDTKFPFSGIHPVTGQAFEHQLDKLGRAFEFVGLADIKSHLNGVRRLPERSCIITFDDGLREQYDTAWAILRRKGIPAAFFVNTAPILSQTVLTVHKVQWCRAYISPIEFRYEVERRAAAVGFSLSKMQLPSDEVMALQYRYDEVDVRRLKYLLNFVVSAQLRDKIVTSIFQDQFGDEAAFSSKFYMDPAQWRTLSQSGCLGTHSHVHLPLAESSKAEVLADLNTSVCELEKHTGNRMDACSYPYGGPGAVSLEVEQAAQAIGLSIGFTMERAFNRSLDRPLILARADTNDVIGGKAPQFAYKNSQFVVSRFGLRRQHYFNESVEV